MSLLGAKKPYPALLCVSAGGEEGVVMHWWAKVEDEDEELLLKSVRDKLVESILKLRKEKQRTVKTR